MARDDQTTSAAPALQWKLWIYTNYDCNLRCSYCVAKSSPNAPRRAIGLANVRRLVDEAVALGFTDVFFTGGEPFILNEIYDMLAYASARVKTTVLTNAMILRGPRLEKLVAIANDNLIVQVSLDGGQAEHHDAYRGRRRLGQDGRGYHSCSRSAASACGSRRPKRRQTRRILKPSARFIAHLVFPIKITSSAHWPSAATRKKGWSLAWPTWCPS